MDDLHFFITDVFATTKYSGNQLATVLHDGKMSDDEMQHVAAEFGFSETTFIMAREPMNDGIPVRIFTPKAEIDFAGHPTLGTAHVLLQHVLDRPVDPLLLRLKVGAIPVRAPEGDAPDKALWMRQNSPRFEHGMDRVDLGAVLGLDVDEISSAWPISQVTTGLPFTIVPLETMNALRRAHVDPSRYETWSRTVWAKGILVFCFGGHTPEQQFAVRVFVPHLGIAEDPATGSGNGCLAAYLLHHRCLGSESIDLRVGQGYELGRPSEILVRARKEDETYSIEIGGRVIEVASGDLRT